MNVINGKIHSARKRIFRNLLIRYLLTALSISLVTGLLLVVIDRFFSPGWPLYPIIAGLVVIGIVTAVILAFRIRPTERMAAIMIDEKAGTEERISSALEVETGEASESGPMTQALLRDAENHAVPLNSGELFPWQGNRSLAVFIVILLLFGASFFIPSFDIFGAEEARAEQKEDKKVIVREIKRLEKAKQILEKVELPQNQVDIQKLSKEMDIAMKSFQSPRINKKKALVKLSKLQEEIAMEKRKMGLKESARALAKSETARKLSEALKRGDLEEMKKAARQLAKEAREGKFSEQEMKDMAEALKESAKKLEPAKQLSDAMKKAGDKLARAAEDNQNQNSQKDNKGSQDQKKSEQDKQNQQDKKDGQKKDSDQKSGQQGENDKKDGEKSQQGKKGEQQGQQNKKDGQQGQQGKQGQQGDQDKQGEQSGEKSGQQGKQGQKPGEKDGEGGKGGKGKEGTSLPDLNMPGINSPIGFGSKNKQMGDAFEDLASELQNMEQLAEEMEAMSQAEELISQSKDQINGQGQKPGSGQGQGQGQGNSGKGQSYSMVAGGSGPDAGASTTNKETPGSYEVKPIGYKDRQSGEKSDKQSFYVPVYSPEHLPHTSKIKKVKGQMNKQENQDSLSLPVASEPGKEVSKTDYTEVYTDYRKAADDALSKEEIPASYRGLVKDYFDSIEPAQAAEQGNTN